MSILRKVTSLVSATAVAAVALGSSMTALAASEFAEYADALATAGVINTQSAESGYRLGDNITRAEMAKIALKISEGTEVTPTGKVFSDVSVDNSLAGAIEAAAEAGIVSKANAKFRPNDLVTRAEMVKMLMAAKGVEPTDVSAGFEDLGSTDATLAGYINAAAAEGYIATGASFRPNATATRGEAFKVAAGVAGLLDGGDIGDIFGSGSTSTGTTSTGTTTTPVVVKAGALGVALNPASAANGTQVPMAGIIRFAVVDFTAGSADISLNSVELKKAGLATVSSSNKVWFEKNGLRVSGKASFTSEGNVVISFAPAYVVKAGSTESIDLYVELKDTAAGTDYQFVSGVVGSSAETVSGSFSTPVLRTANYAVATFSGTTASSASTYKASSDFVELGAFKISNTDTNSETRDLQFQSVTVYQSGSADFSNLTDIKLERNGVVVSTSAKVEGKMLTFVLSNDVIKDGASATYYVKAKVANVEKTADTYQIYLKNTSDINVIEASTGFRATTDDGSKFVGALYTVTGGDVKFEKGASALSANYAPGSANVVLLDGTITAKNAIRLEDPRVTLASTLSGNLSQYFTTLYLTIGGSTFSVTATGAANANLDFLGTVTVSGTTPVKLYGTLKDTAPNGTLKVSELKLESFMGTNEYVANQEKVTAAVGSISAITVTIDKTSLNVSRNDGLGNTKLAAGSKGVTLYGLALSSSKGNPINVTSASFAFAGTGSFLNNAYATLYVDGTAVSSKTIDAASIKFDGFTATVSSSKNVNMVVKADFSDTFASGTLQTTLSALAAVDSVSSKDVTGFSTPAGATFTVAAANADLAASDINPQASLFTAGSTSNKVFAFKVTAKNDTIKLKDVVLTGTTDSKGAFANFRLADAAGNVIASASTEGTNDIRFESIATDKTSIAMDKSASFYVIADANTNTNSTGSVFELTSVILTGTNGADVAVANTVTSKAHAVAENTAVVAKASNSSKSIVDSALRFTVTAAGKNNITLDSLKLSSLLSGYTGSQMVKVYKDSIGSDNLAFTGVTGADVTLAKTANAKNTVDAGSTVTYIVVVEGALVDSSAQSVDWTLSLKNVVLDTKNDASVLIDGSAYNNVGSFPITESK